MITQHNSVNKTNLVKLRKKMVRNAVHPMTNHFQQGVALLEALIAILIFSFGVLGIVGLQSAMVKNTSQNKMRSDASYIAERRISMMWANSANLASFIESNTVVPELPNGKRTTVMGILPGEITVTVRWTASGEPEHQYSATAYVVGAN